MPRRFIFRQVYFEDLRVFLRDGEVRSKNHSHHQFCHQTSHQAIVDRRGTDEFPMPCGGVVNDYVAFYFSPLTAFASAIHNGRVHLRGPDGVDFGIARSEHRIFLVANVDRVAQSGLRYYFSDYALNSRAPPAVLTGNLAELETHVHWAMFDETPMVSHIPEIGYAGVCSYFFDRASPARYQNRSRMRMAEFLVREAVPLSMFDCIVAKSPEIGENLVQMMNASAWSIPVLVKPGCYF